MTFDPEQLDDVWNVDSFPGLIEVEKVGYPTISLIKKFLGDTFDVVSIRNPVDCIDGF